MLKKTVWLAMAAAVLLSACNTVSGFGEDVQKAGSKLAKAQQLGVKTLTEQEFENMLAE